jgi:prepilin-type N-terminal cleavage/methylation domain-containing protein
MSYKLNKKLGFTLIELLVVISIIGMLSSIVLASLNSARIKARDVRRKADLHSLELAIALFNDATGTYPDNALTDGGNWPASYRAQLAPYLPNPPVDPLSNTGGRYYGSYRMTWAPDATCNGQYVLWAYIEGSNTGANTCGFGGPHYFRLLGSY